ncbi:MAG TPA: GNAT family N-acetyltransferase [Casimicrobiaceae bacterium]|nr:GNAT family N-acetyltransferase [Casimicrobiaceae bacterium]
MKAAASEADVLEARRLEERSLNASGAFQSLLYDGWLLGYRPGPAKRLRCVNPFYPSTLPLSEKLAHCVEFYARAKLPTIFRLLPFSEPATLDGWLEVEGWKAFDRTRVLHAELADRAAAALPDVVVELLEPPAWEPVVAPLLGISEAALPRFVERAASYPLPHAGALIRKDGDVVACGLLKLEGDHAGLFAVQTARPWRGRGLGRAIVGALLAEARRRGAVRAYLQVTEENVPALAVYAHFGFTTAYTYWYRARREERESA